MAAVVDQGVDVGRAATAVVDQGGPIISDDSAEGRAAADDVLDHGHGIECTIIFLGTDL